MSAPAGVARVLLAVAVAGALAVGCQEGSEDAEPRPPGPSRAVPTTVDHPAYGAVEDALREAGSLVVCGRRADAGDASGSYERRIFTVAAESCPAAEGGPRGGTVVVNAYDSMTIRDQSAPIDFGDRLMSWTYLQFVVSVTPSSSAQVVGGVERAMTSLGAEKTYDQRAARPDGG